MLSPGVVVKKHRAIIVRHLELAPSHNHSTRDDHTSSRTSLGRSLGNVRHLQLAPSHNNSTRGSTTSSRTSLGRSLENVSFSVVGVGSGGDG